MIKHLITHSFKSDTVLWSVENLTKGNQLCLAVDDIYLIIFPTVEHRAE